MRQINLIVVHCTASRNGKARPVAAIEADHRARGFSSIGYHYVIYRNGGISTGRDVTEIGAHVTGYNQKSLGICLVGTDRFTEDQWESLRDLVTRLQSLYPESRVVGHRDLSPDQNANGIVEKFEWLKTCPGFDVADWIFAGMHPLPDHLPEAQ